MVGEKIVAIVGRILWALGLLLVVSQIIKGERLPIKTYTIADGLVSNKISRIVRDSRGFLWFCTEGGLSRFDGYTFTNYTIEQGLPSNWVDDFLETRSGVFLVATHSGLCVFNPLGVALPQDKLVEQPNTPPMFTVYRPGQDEAGSHMKVLYEDSAASIWCGTLQGLYRIEVTNNRVTFHYVELGIQSNAFEHHRIAAIVEEQPEVLLIATRKELFRRFSDGRIESVTAKQKLPDAQLMGIVQDSDGRLWIGTGIGLYGVPQPGSEPGHNGPAARLSSVNEGLPCIAVTTLFQSSDGRLWVGTACGLFEFLKDERRFRPRLDLKDMRDASVWSLTEDMCGNLWIGTADGAIRLARNGFTTYTEADGLGFRAVYRITESSAGEIDLYTRFDDLHISIDKFNGEGFVSLKIKPRALGVSPVDWHQRQFPLRDSQGEWWWPTDQGLFRFAKANRIEEILNARPIAHYTVKDGLPGNTLRGIYEDRRGDIWISAATEVKTSVARWERKTGKIHTYAKADGLVAKGALSTVCEDKAGNLWLGFENGDVARNQGKRFITFTSVDGIPEGGIKQLLCDSAGRIWISSSKGGLGRIDDPASDRPQIVKYTMLDGLASNSILSIAEDGMNRLYVATPRGLNHIDFDTGSVKLFTTTDGLANDQVDAMFRDNSGAFWFGTSSGVSRLTPETEVGRPLPSIFINGIKVVGDSQRISAIGETILRGFELAPNQNHIEIGFGSLFFAAGDLIRYQYKLEGADADWQPPTFQRSVNYANLRPGSYHFLVRAINAEGSVSPQPATLDFRVSAPVWQRWWFVAIIAGLVGLLAFALYRYRVARLLELERVRTRIAADLHDDIGSNLSQIAIWSDVAQREARHGGGGQLQHAHADGAPEPLERIASTARETASAMSDIVWAINPRRDFLSDLISRMRRFAGEAFDAFDIVWQLDAPHTELSLQAESRREVFLIFKECVNNIVRHAQCTRVEAALTIEGSGLRLRISDDGRGFDPQFQSEGHGLDSMRERARNLRGALEIESAPGRGTTVEFTMPLNPTRWPR
jgi:ligand-binding sensor domain-containing protein/signal transduction histidine kinase